MTAPKQSRPWRGKPPVDSEEANRRLAEIAMETFATKGMRKAFMAEVARIAGISRPTLYSYYPTKESLMFGAMTLEVGGWMRKQERRMRRFETPQERLVEGVLYSIAELPKTRVLKFIADPEYIPYVAKEDPGLLRSLRANVQALEPVFELSPQLRDRQEDIAELVQRIIMSFLQYQIGRPRSKAQLRAFMHRTLVPAAGLDILRK